MHTLRILVRRKSNGESFANELACPPIKHLPLPPVGQLRTISYPPMHSAALFRRGFQRKERWKNSLPKGRRGRLRRSCSLMYSDPEKSGTPRTLQQKSLAQ